MSLGFERFALRSGLLQDLSSGEHPSRLHAWVNDSPHGREARSLEFQASCSTHFGYVSRGQTTLETQHGTWTLSEGHYFCVDGRLRVTGGAGIVMERLGISCLNSFGGPVESRGRLNYISGCSDTLLVSPTCFGYPCLNALYFPPNIDQHPHTHPSIRLGIVAKGQGWCRTLEGDHPLRRGEAFVIHSQTIHSFRTESDTEMVVIAYHPDSDFGPQDTNHPMINRTIVDGVSAARRLDLHSNLNDAPVATRTG